MDEFVLWKGKANLKIGMAKIAGELTITNKRISFKALSKNTEIRISEIKNVDMAGKIIKRIRIETSGKEYSFFIPHAKEVLELIKRFIREDL